MDKAEAVFEKLARLSKSEKLVRGLEDELGIANLGQFDRDWAEQEAQNQINQSVALRHPVLTGIPTLGIWPAIARASAEDSMLRKVLSKNEKVKENYMNLLRTIRQQQLEDNAQAIERERATQPAQVAGVLGSVGAAYLASKNRREEK